MRKQIRFFVFVISLVTLFSGVLSAQVTFTLPDSGNNYGINESPGLMGAAWGDYDDDGDLDLVLVGPRMWRNDFNTSQVFTPVRASSLSELGTGEFIFFDPGGQQSNSAIWADFNGDGKLDLLYAAARFFYNYLADSNKFSFMFDYQSAATGGGWGVTGGDYDNDGDIDVAYAAGTGGNGSGPVYILKNDGSGNFADVAADAIGVTINLESWNPQWVDVNNDGWLDLWMPNLRRNTITANEPCYLLMNLKDGNFEIPASTGITQVSAIMSTWADYDNDGDMDVFCVPLGTEDGTSPRFWQNDGTGNFTDVAPALGLDSATYVTNSPIRNISFGDYDNDGDLDLLFYMRSASLSPRTPQLWSNNGDGTFTEVGVQAGIGTLGTPDTRTACFVDWNQDGWLDIFVRNNGSPAPYLFKNNGGNNNHWIVIKPEGNGTTVNKHGIGARITVYAGGKMMTRDVQTGGGNGNNAELWPHFGLGSATSIDSIKVRWHGDVIDVDKTLSGVIDGYYTFKQGEGIVVPNSAPQSPAVVESYMLQQNYPNPFNPTTNIKFAVPTSNNVRIVLVNMLGQVVKEVVNSTFAAGEHEVTLNASNLSSGVYFYRMEAGSFVSTKKLVLMK